MKIEMILEGEEEELIYDKLPTLKEAILTHLFETRSKIYANNSCFSTRIRCSRKINDFITVKLKNEKTVIYVRGERFDQCKYLLLTLPPKDIPLYDDIASIDEIEAFCSHSAEHKKPIEITPYQEFIGHCSNLQAWVEYGYDTRLLHRNLAFPLLKKLTEHGDKVAQQVFREEIARRFESGNLNVMLFLLEENYLDYLTEEEIALLGSNFSTEQHHKILKALNPKITPRQINIAEFLIHQLSFVSFMKDYTFLERHEGVINKQRVFMLTTGSAFEQILRQKYDYLKTISLSQLSSYLLEGRIGYLRISEKGYFNVTYFLKGIEVLSKHGSYESIHLILPTDHSPLILYSTQHQFRFFIAPMEFRS